MRENKNSVKWAVSPGIRATSSADGAVLLDIERGVIFTLNTVGAKLWQMLESSAGRSSLDDIVDVLRLDFDIPREQLEEDTNSYLQDLLKQGLVRTNGVGQPAKRS
jgi:hypothetical protein